MSKYLTAPLITLLLLVLVACVSLPKLLPDGSVSPKETEYVPAWGVRSRVAELFEAHGWGKPPVDTSEPWLNAAMWCAGLAVTSFVAYYLTKLHEFGGSAVILGISAIICTGVAQIAGWLWLIPAVLILGGFVYIGLRCRNSSALGWIKENLLNPREENDS
jgi:hypothetical protein